MRKAKEQASLPEELKDTTTLAEDLEAETTIDYVGYRYSYRRNIGFVKPVKLSDLKAGDNLVDAEHLKAFNRAVTPQAFERRKRKGGKSFAIRTTGMALMFLLSTGYMVFEGVFDWSHYSIEEGDVFMAMTTQSYPPLISITSFFGLGALIWRGSHYFIDESEIEKLPFTELGKLKKLDGTAYEIGDPSYEEVYQAAKLMEELTESSKLLREANERLSNLRKSDSPSGAIETQEEIRDKIRERITVIESEIEALLRNDTIMNETEEAITREGVS